MEGRTFKLVALDAIVEGDSFYGATSGKISATDIKYSSFSGIWYNIQPGTIG